MAISELLASLLQPVFDCLPRISARPKSNETLVVDGPISGPRTTSRPQVYFPILTHVEYWPAAAVPLECELQSLTSADGVTVAINASVVLTVTYPLMLREQTDHESWEAFTSLKIRQSIYEAVSGHNFDDFRSRAKDLIWFEAEEALAECGVELIDLAIEDITKTRCLRLMTNSPVLE